MYLKNLKIKTTNLLVLLSLLFAFSACKSDRKAKKMPEDISSFLYAYTSGTISKSAPIRLRFTNAVIEPDEIGSDLEKGILTFSPTINGDAIWEDDRTLLFQPEEWLTSKTTYLVKVKLKRLFKDVPKAAESFEFNFKTKDQYVDVSVSGLEAEDMSDLSTQMLKGSVYTADVSKSDRVEAILTATQNGKALPIRWEHRSNQKDHDFFVEKVVRGNDKSAVVLNWKTKSFGNSKNGKRSVEIPSLKTFQLMDARVIQEGDQYVELNFSDPVLKNQDLQGLITISDYNGSLRFIVDRNQVRVYPKSRLNGERKVKVRTGVKNSASTTLQKMGEWELQFETLKPQLKLAGNGVIMPKSDGLVFPFEAVGLNSVIIEVFKIYDNNILQFLQTNKLDQHYELERVGEVLLQKQFDLQDLNPKANSNSWGRYAIDLQDLVNQDPNAIYQVRIGFNQQDASYPCNDKNADAKEDDLTVLASTSSESEKIESIWKDQYYYYDDYDWSHRQNPCFRAYYQSHHFVRRNVLASNLGLIAKRGKDGSLFVAASDLRSTDPISNVQLDFYNFAQQLIRTVYTNADGTTNIDLEEKPFLVVASAEGQKGYLRLLDPNALSLSRFDVSGAETQKGLKGFIYGERGVWRPGDSLYLNFVLEDKNGKLPANHPVHFELVDPRGQVQQKFTTSENVNNVYPLTIATNADAPTGNWRAKVRAGGATFSKSLKIETVKPNRLKIELDFGKEELAAEDKKLNADLQVNWLHGAPAQNLKAKIEVQVQAVKTKFAKFNEYHFDDPARKFSAEPQVLFEGQVNAAGTAKVNGTINVGKAAPGKLKAKFKTRAFEQSGDFSIDNFSMPYSPYNSYAGIYIPTNKYNSKRLEIGVESPIDFVVVDKDGKAVKNRKLDIGLYRVNWRWWWDRDGYDNTSRYNNTTHRGSKEKISLTTNSKGEVQWNLKVNDWGRYLVRVCDTESGHCSGDFFYSGSPWNEGGGKNRDAAAMLNFTAEKETYQVGETIKITVPASDVGRCLISLETGSKVLETYWKDTKAGENTYSFYATKEMAPTVYANVTLVQPHAQVENDLPIRMYGVIPIRVEDPKNKLEPELKMAKVLAPEEKVNLEVTEKNGRPMAYTIAMVDEGLLDLTRFKTPNPWNAFYAREALGVNTWDIYDQVLGAYGGKLERILSIGGDDEVLNPTDKKNANRFKPVVKHLGPFYLKKGGKAKHEIRMPNYVGSVKTMVIASDNGAYGSTEKVSPVRKPLMVLATLPRVLGPTEQLQLPVNIFAMEDKVKQVKVTVEERSGLVNVIGDKTQHISFASPGEKMLYFNLDVQENIGIARFKITAEGGGEVATQEIEIDVRNPNPRVTDVLDKIVDAGQDWQETFNPIGMLGTNEAILEVSNIPPMNLGERLKYLIRYPHGCIEQTTSSGFPQLYVNRLIELDEEQKNKISDNVAATIDRLKRFQLSDGSFTYWPGASTHSDWGTNYAGHFLLEAKKLGYAIPANLLERWTKAQKKLAREWEYGNYRSQWYYELTQSYRLYTLALANAPEWGAMNRLRENKKISVQTAWRLAATYALAGKPDIANEIANSLDTNIKEYTELGGSYGSSLRDKAMILETLTILGDRQKAGKVLQDISNLLTKRRWYGTQTVAYSLTAVGKFVGGKDKNDRYSFTYQLDNGASVDAGSDNPIMQIQIPMTQNSQRSFRISNTAGQVLFARLINSGQPVVGDQTSKDSDLLMEVNYKTMSGKKLDPTNIAQGTDFVAEVVITNPGKRAITYEEMALSQIFPSGWEIHNARMDEIQTFKNNSVPEYQDIRDDRVYTYFDIKRKTNQVYRIQLNAAYQGKFYLPTTYCEAMYDNSISSQRPGFWVNVVAPNSL